MSMEEAVTPEPSAAMVRLKKSLLVGMIIAFIVLLVVLNPRHKQHQRELDRYLVGMEASGQVEPGRDPELVRQGYGLFSISRVRGELFAVGFCGTVFVFHETEGA